MTTPIRVEPPDTADLDRATAEAEARAIVVWRGERIGFPSLPDRIARIDDRDERDGLFQAYLEAVEALNPRYEERLAHWLSAGVLAASPEVDPRAMAADLERLVLHSETPYYAALRRYLALIDIEQGDATIADVWHIVRGAAWTRWFGEREVRRALQATRRDAEPGGSLDGWLGAELMLEGTLDHQPSVAEGAVNAAYATLVSSPEWLAQELGVAAAEVVPFVDFATFVRLWRIRRTIGELQHEVRLFASADPEPDHALHRAYYTGIVGHITGVSVPESLYLRAVPTPFASARKLEVTILAADLVDALERRHGLTWWRSAGAADLVGQVRAASTVDDALAQLGYDALDWRPLLRQVRTRLIGEMSGYGGPNITTRAGTRKV